MYVLYVVFSSVDEDVQLKLLYVSCCISDDNTGTVELCTYALCTTLTMTVCGRVCL